MKTTVGVTLGMIAGTTGLDKIEIDGQDITKALSGLRLDAEVGYLTKLTIDFPCVSRTRIDGTVQAFVDDVTRNALIVLGWTPPRDDFVVGQST